MRISWLTRGAPHCRRVAELLKLRKLEGCANAICNGLKIVDKKELKLLTEEMISKHLPNLGP